MWVLAGCILLTVFWELGLQDNTLSQFMSHRTRLAPLVQPAQLPTFSSNTKPANQPKSLSKNTHDNWHSMVIQPNDSFYRLVAPFHLSNNSTQALLKNALAKQYLTKLLPDHKISFFIDDNTIGNVLYQLNSTQALVISRVNGTYQSKITRSIQEAQLSQASGDIESNLSADAQKAGLNNSLIAQLSRIFSWKIDFAHQLHQGDHFAVIYEQHHLPDHQLDTGGIIGAEIIVHGKLYQAVRYVNQHGEVHYYTPQGNSLESAFLRAPVKYTRISSSFSRGRMHPILGYVRPHYGTDMAAPMGTPLHAAADGVIAFMGPDGGYGNLVKIRHTHGYSTRYAHMSHFNSHLHVGSHVRRGQVIGYVGMTGLADGPHVHYEVRIHNKPYDPMKVKLPDAAPINATEKQAFLSQAQYYVQLLDQTNHASLNNS